ncbi:MAG TPA: hypothetical protein VG737_00800 [Cyclobacteriaceae bacterium]|nr:hypothetical protein [Cyclobacteriaceae bacterium]
MKTLLLVSGALIAGIGSLLTTSLHDRALYDEDFIKSKPSPEFKWNQAAPAGTGSYQEEWKPGAWPMGFDPLIGPDNKLWMIGQKLSWSSSDGIAWNGYPKKDWGERIYMQRIYFRNKIFAFGGVEVGKGFRNDLWVSRDGKVWEQLTAKAAWMPRRGQTMTEFQGKLWLFGGTPDPEENDTNKIMNDIWSSDDGIAWTKISDNAPWRPRKHPEAVVFKDQLWLMGGIDHADVWRSGDGKTWTQVTEKAPWETRSDFGLKVYNNLMFVFGGRGGNPARDFNDVWYSIDGSDWRLQTEHAPWVEQTGTHSVVFRDKLWLYNGKHKGQPRAGDIWTMEAANN